MYAFIELAGHQYRVEPEQIIVTEKTGHKIGENFECEKIIALGKEDGLQVGDPYLKTATVQIQVLDDIRAKKILGFKYKKRKGYARKFGHRQNVQKLKILDVKDN